MEKGMAVEFGTHDELMSLKNGKYHRLYTLQAKGFVLDDKGGVAKDVDGLVLSLDEQAIDSVVAQGLEEESQETK